MACWRFAGKSLAAAAAAIVKKDPAAARRLLAECPDLRSKSILEGELMADEVRRHPEEKLRWAEANLEGHVRVKAMNAGITALAAKNAAAALEILSEWPPTIMKLGGQFTALGARMKEDANAALTWASENTYPSERYFTGIQACLNFIKQNPKEGLAILPSLPMEYRKYMGFAVVWQAKSDSPQTMMDALRALPEEVQLPVIRHWAAELRDEPTSENWLLAALSDPTERATAIEVMALKQLSSFDSNSKQPEVLEWLGQFQTPEDKQAAARVVPYLTNLTENQRQDVLSRLK